MERYPNSEIQRRALLLANRVTGLAKGFEYDTFGSVCSDYVLRSALLEAVKQFEEYKEKVRDVVHELDHMMGEHYAAAGPERSLLRSLVHDQYKPSDGVEAALDKAFTTYMEGEGVDREQDMYLATKQFYACLSEQGLEIVVKA